jgi:hypothetical protein
MLRAKDLKDGFIMKTRVWARLVVVGLFLFGIATIGIVLSSCTAVDGLDSNIYGNSVYPQLTNTYDLGSNTLVWNNLWVNNINGLPYTGGGGAIALTSAHILVGNGSNVATDVAASGDLTVDNTGKFTVTGIQGHSITLAAGYLEWTGAAWTFGAGGGGITSVDTGTPSNITGILTGNGSILGSITDNSSNWNTAYSDRITSATGSGVLTLGISGNALTGSVNLSGYQTSLSFSDSLVNNSGTVTLVNDSASPSASYYYGTNSGGTLGYFALPSLSGFVPYSGATGDVTLGAHGLTSASLTDSGLTSGRVPYAGTGGLLGDSSHLTYSNTGTGTLTTGTFSGALSGNATTATSAGSVTGLSVTAGKTLTVSDSATIATNSITLAGGEVLTFTAGNNLTLATTGATSVTLPTSGTLMSNPMTTLGDIIYENATPTADRLAGSTTASTRKFLTSTATAGGVAQAPVWNVLATTDIPDISATYETVSALGSWAGSSNITTLGTITTGAWSGTVITPAKGGTGVANGTNNTITFTGNYTLGLTLSNNTALTLPTSGTLVADTVTTLSSLASIGTITTGTWHGGLITGTYGGTGVNNGTNTLTLAGNFTTSGAHSLTLTTTGDTNVTLPTSGTLMSTTSQANYGLTIVNNTWSSITKNATWYLGSTAAPSTTADRHRIYFPTSGTLTSIYIAAYQSSATIGTSETFSVYIRINNATDVLVTSSATADATQYGYNIWSNTGLSQAVNAGDYFEIKIVTPNWTTAPGSMYVSGSVSVNMASVTTHSYGLTVVNNNWTSPAINTTYYVGSTQASSTTANVHRIYFPSSGTLTSIYIAAYQSSTTVGTGETFSVYVRINNTTDVLLTSSAVANAAQYAYNVWSNTNLNTVVNAGDYMEIKIVTPAWATPPGTMYLSGSIEVQ